MGFTDISPSDSQRASIGTGIKMIADPYNYKGLILFGSQGGLRCSDSNSPAWQPVNLSASASVGSWSQSWDFVTSNGAWASWAAPTFYCTGGATYSAGTGWQAIRCGSGLARYLTISKSFSSSTLTAISVAYNLSDGIDLNGEVDIYLVIGGVQTQVAQVIGPQSAGNHTLSASGSWSNVTEIRFLIAVDTPSDQSYTATALSASASGTGTNPFGGSGGGAEDETFINDIQGSVNQQDTFFWLSKRTVSGVDYVYCNRTFDGFRTRKATQIAPWVSGMGYSIQLGSYGSPGALTVLVSAGDPGGTSGIYESTNSAVTFSKITGTSLLSGGGALAVPYAYGGANNASSSPAYAYVRGMSGGSVQLVRYTGATVTIGAGSVPINGYVLNTTTIDGNYMQLPFSNQAYIYSSDGFATWGTATAITGSGVRGMTGWPENNQFSWTYGAACLASTSDGGATWTDERSDWDTFASGAYGSGGSVIVTAFGDLGAFYSQPVVTR